MSESEKNLGGEEEFGCSAEKRSSDGREVKIVQDNMQI